MDRFTWSVVAGVLALVVAGVAAAVLLGRSDAQPNLSMPGGVALAYALAMERGDADQAWNLLATSAQSQTTKERFFQRAGGPRRPDERVRLTTENEQVQGDKATLDLVRTYDGGSGPLGFGSGPVSLRSPVRLALESGQWRIVVPPDPFVIAGRD